MYGGDCRHVGKIACVPALFAGQPLECCDRVRMDADLIAPRNPYALGPLPPGSLACQQNCIEHSGERRLLYEVDVERRRTRINVPFDVRHERGMNDEDNPLHGAPVAIEQMIDHRPAVHRRQHFRYGALKARSGSSSRDNQDGVRSAHAVTLSGRPGWTAAERGGDALS